MTIIIKNNLYEWNRLDKPVQDASPPTATYSSMQTSLIPHRRSLLQVLDSYPGKFCTDSDTQSVSKLIKIFVKLIVLIFIVWS